MSPVGKRKKRVGLALSGGAARGIAHIGVLEVLDQEKIPIDMIAGTSAGAIMGAVYAAGQDTHAMVAHALDAGWKRLAPLVDISLPVSGFLKGKKIIGLIAEYVGGDIKFSDLKIPFACVATDIYTGEEVVLNSGSVAEALRASISVPGIFTVVKRGDHYLVDGGLTTPVPVNVVKRMGADFIIAVNVNADVTDRMPKASQKRLQARKEPNLLQVLMQSLYITTYSLAATSMAEADIIIEPSMPHIYTADFHKADEMIERGREAARKALPELKKKLEEL